MHLNDTAIGGHIGGQLLVLCTYVMLTTCVLLVSIGQA